MRWVSRAATPMPLRRRRPASPAAFSAAGAARCVACPGAPASPPCSMPGAPAGRPRSMQRTAHSLPCGQPCGEKWRGSVRPLRAVGKQPPRHGKRSRFVPPSAAGRNATRAESHRILRCPVHEPDTLRPAEPVAERRIQRACRLALAARIESLRAPERPQSGHVHGEVRALPGPPAHFRISPLSARRTRIAGPNQRRDRQRRPGRHRRTAPPPHTFQSAGV